MRNNCEKCETKEWYTEFLAYYTVISILAMIVCFVLFIITGNVIEHLLNIESTPMNIYGVTSLTFASGSLVALVLFSFRDPYGNVCRHPRRNDQC